MVPPERQKALVKFIHDMAHTGVKRTFESVRQRYFWKNMKKIVTNIVRECSECAKSKVTTKTNVPPKTFAFSERFSHVHLDLVGPLPTSPYGNSYILTVIDRYMRW